MDGTPVIEIRDLTYNRYYPAFSGYNFCRITVNFGLPNIPIPGYPADFYVLNDCLAAPDCMYSERPLRTTFGNKKFNVE